MVTMYQSPASLVKTVDEVTRRIVNAVRPKRILLFGSGARGEFHANSDLDFLVIMHAPVHRRKVAQEIYRNLHGVELPVDIVVATDDDLSRYGGKSWNILHPALAEGRVVYDERR
jgi:predicted nucleotidyltransferase